MTSGINGTEYYFCERFVNCTISISLPLSYQAAFKHAVISTVDGRRPVCAHLNHFQAIGSLLVGKQGAHGLTALKHDPERVAALNE